MLPVPADRALHHVGRARLQLERNDVLLVGFYRAGAEAHHARARERESCHDGKVRRIAVNGRVLFDSDTHVNVSPRERRVGYVPQDVLLFPRR